MMTEPIERDVRRLRIRHLTTLRYKRILHVAFRTGRCARHAKVSSAFELIKMTPFPMGGSG